MVSKKSFKKGQGIKASTLQTFLSNSYEPRQKQLHNIDGYIRDDSLSGQRATVYHNPVTGKTVVTHKGTQSIQDWATDAWSAIGMANNTTRMKHAKKIQKEAEAKYGKDNVLTLGHSLGAKLAEHVGQESKEIVTFNKPTTLENIGKRIPKKQTDVRTNNDPVSFLAGTQKNQQQIKTFESGTWNPIKAHTTDQLEKLGDEYIGQGIRKQSPWINHVKSYASKHGLSYKAALKAAKGSYQKSM